MNSCESERRHRQPRSRSPSAEISKAPIRRDPDIRASQLSWLGQRSGGGGRDGWREHHLRDPQAWAVNGVTTSFSQLMGMPQEQLSDKYLFPGYNNVTLNEQLRIANVDTVQPQ